MCVGVRKVANRHYIWITWLMPTQIWSFFGMKCNFEFFNSVKRDFGLWPFLGSWWVIISESPFLTHRYDSYYLALLVLGLNCIFFSFLISRCISIGYFRNDRTLFFKKRKNVRSKNLEFFHEELLFYVLIHLEDLEWKWNYVTINGSKSLFYMWFCVK